MRSSPFSTITGAPGIVGELNEAARNVIDDQHVVEEVNGMEGHSRHLVMALWYLRRHNRDEATRLIRDAAFEAVQPMPGELHRLS